MKIICLECGSELQQINGSHLTSKRCSGKCKNSNDYKRLHPGEKVVSEEVSQRIRRQNQERPQEYYINSGKRAWTLCNDKKQKMEKIHEGHKKWLETEGAQKILSESGKKGGNIVKFKQVEDVRKTNPDLYRAWKSKAGKRMNDLCKKTDLKRYIEVRKKAGKIGGKKGGKKSSYYLHNIFAKEHPDEYNKRLKRCGYGVHGHFYSEKNKKVFYYQSLLELKCMNEMEQNKKIKEYKYGPRIGYLGENGESKIYNVDFQVFYDDKIVLVEVKPLNFILSGLDSWNGTSLIPKLEVAETYCEKNNYKFEFFF